jgi:uncharacterized protein YdhG (YjbR/CyaY superfamily)
MGKINSINDYIQSFPIELQINLIKLRALIQKAAPEAIEKISYEIPTFYLNGNLVHFAAFKNHIGFYPTSSGIAEFTEELKGYKTSKGTVQFPINQPLPMELIKKIVKFRVDENTQRVNKTKIRKSQQWHTANRKKRAR